MQTIIGAPANGLQNYHLYGKDGKEMSIKDIVKQNGYDHIFVIIRLGNEEYKDDIQINDWIGLRFYGLLWNRLF